MTKTFLSALIAAFALASCETSQVATQSSAAARSQFAEGPTDRPGLGTKWGETRESRVGYGEFQRADPRHPIAAAAIYYNDAAGIRAMAQAVAWQRGWAVLPSPAESLISVGIKGEGGRFLPGLTVRNRWFVVGDEGRRYSIVVRNRSHLRLEVVASVDGFDVIDGRKASLSKRGYVIRPRSHLVIDGFRQSTEAVAAFRFSSVRESYASEKHHDTRNVGVIGFAVFNERGTDPWTDREVQKRLEAKPFPGRFATPP